MPLMKCGHAGNARQKDGSLVCAICIGIKPGADVIDANPDLTGRMAECVYGHHRVVPSSLDLPFFAHHPDRERDEYYCGCYGWD